MAEHKSRVDQDRRRGVVVACSCGWKRALGYSPMVEEVAAKWLLHSLDVAYAEKHPQREQEQSIEEAIADLIDAGFIEVARDGDGPDG